MKCRHCAAELTLPFVDLGSAPPSNAYLSSEQLNKPETTYPLKVMVCESCWLVQTQDFARADELFDQDYAYFSSTSKSWLLHAQRFSQMAIERFGVDQDSFVVEIASNDGYLLRNFVAANIKCLGVEPTASTSQAAAELGIAQCRAFFGHELAKDLVANGKSADLVVANNVLAHVPDINDFCRGVATILKPDGVVSFEFPHLLNLIKEKQFDTIYHEHFSYLSLVAVQRILTSVGLEVFDVETLPTHGGSLRVFAAHKSARTVSASVARMRENEREFGLEKPETYTAFQHQIERLRDDFLSFLLAAKASGKSVAAYGAAAKGNTLLNFAGIRADLISYVVDAAPSKQGKFLPGSHIPIHAPSYLQDHRPDILIILPWNIASEIATQNQELRALGTRLVRVLPEIQDVC